MLKTALYLWITQKKINVNTWLINNIITMMESQCFIIKIPQTGMPQRSWPPLHNSGINESIICQVQRTINRVFGFVFIFL